MIPAAIVAVFLLLCGGYYLYFIPTATISIDINPSLELSINRFDRVISVNGYNSDGDALADSLDIRFMNCQDAVSELLENENVTDLLSQDEMMAITVGGSNDGQCSRILENVQTCTKSHEESTHCYTATDDETHEAHNMGLSCGRYKAYQELQTLDPDITPEEVNEMSMKEIYDRIASLTGQSTKRTVYHYRYTVLLFVIIVPAVRRYGQSDAAEYGHAPETSQNKRPAPICAGSGKTPAA